MDAHALLASQGWRGSGHSLHPTSDKTGLSRPLLVSRKQNNLGVGKKQHRTSDMWWMNAFDKSLKGLDTTQGGKVVQTVTNGGLDMVAKGGSKFVGSGGGLYASFVRGESLSGTITPEDEEESLPAKRRKQDEVAIETKETRKARKAAKRFLRAQSTYQVEAVAPEEVDRKEEDDSTLEVETKEESRERRRQKKLSLQKERIAKAITPTKRKKRQKE